MTQRRIPQSSGAGSLSSSVGDGARGAAVAVNNTFVGGSLSGVYLGNGASTTVSAGFSTSAVSSITDSVQQDGFFRATQALTVVDLSVTQWGAVKAGSVAARSERDGVQSLADDPVLAHAHDDPGVRLHADGHHHTEHVLLNDTGTISIT